METTFQLDLAGHLHPVIGHVLPMEKAAKLIDCYPKEKTLGKWF